MSDKKIDITLLNESDIDAVNALYNSTYGTKRCREDFLWEFYKAPAGAAIYVVAKDADTGKIVGTQCAIPIDVINASGTVTRTAKSEDTLVDPNYRGMNIFDNMYALLFDECRKAGIKIIWGFTPARRPFLKLGFDMPFDHSQSLQVFKIGAAYRYMSVLNPKNSFINKCKIFGLCTLAKWKSVMRSFSSGHISVSGLALKVMNKAEITANIMDSECLNKNDFIIRHNADFLDWRLKNNPHHKAIISIEMYQEGICKARVLFNEHKDGAWYVSDEMYTNDLSPKIRAEIFGAAVKALRNKVKVKLLRTWEFSHNVSGREGIARRKMNGFIHLNRGIGFVWKTLLETDIKASDFCLSRLATQGVI